MRIINNIVNFVALLVVGVALYLGASQLLYMAIEMSSHDAQYTQQSVSHSEPIQDVKIKLTSEYPFVQKTQSGAQLMRLSDNVEMTQLEMLRGQ